MTTPDVTFIEGRDPTVSGSPENDPSGFRTIGMQTHDIDALLSIATQEWKNTVGAVPRDVLETIVLPKQIDLYFPTREPVFARGTLYKSITSKLMHNPENPEKPFVPIEQIRGIGVRCDTQMLQSAETVAMIRSYISHEINHVITNCGISPWMRGKTEALTEPLNDALHKKNLSPENFENFDSFDWDPSRIEATDGFAEGDQDYNLFTESTLDELYLASAVTMRDISAEQCWKIWKILLEIGQSTGRYPLNQEIDDAISNTLDEKTAQTLFRSPIFRPMTQDGVHVSVFYDKSGQKALAFPTYRQKNPRYGRNKDGSWDAAKYLLESAKGRIPFTSFVVSKTGAKSRIAEGVLGSYDFFSHEAFKRRIEGSGSKQTQKTINESPGMIFKIKGAQTIRISKEKVSPLAMTKTEEPLTKEQRVVLRWLQQQLSLKIEPDDAIISQLISAPTEETIASILTAHNRPIIKGAKLQSKINKLKRSLEENTIS